MTRECRCAPGLGPCEWCCVRVARYEQAVAALREFQEAQAAFNAPGPRGGAAERSKRLIDAEQAWLDVLFAVRAWAQEAQ